MIRQSELKKILHYDPIKGVFTRLVKVNNRKIGSVAGCIQNGYITIMIAGKPYQGHRLAWIYMKGNKDMPYRLTLKNGIRHDIRWENIAVLKQRLC
jgi:hypothetical protein